MSKKTIWEYLKAKGFSDIAAAAIMGNMEAESNCAAVRLQGDFTAGYRKSTSIPQRLTTVKSAETSLSITVQEAADMVCASGRTGREKQASMIWQKSRVYPSEVSLSRWSGL